MRILALDLLVFGAVILTALLAPRAPQQSIQREGPTSAVSTLAPTATPKPQPSAEGVATWFDAARPGHSSWYTRAGIKFYVAAGPELRALFGQPDGHFYHVNYPVRVCSLVNGKCFRAQVVDWCGCHGRQGVNDDRLADLSPALFTALGAPLGRGVQRIKITVLDK